MNEFQTWGEAITSALVELGEKVIVFLPSFLVAVIIFLGGWVVAISVGKLVEKFFSSLKIDKIASRIGFNGKIIQESEFSFSI